MSLFKIKVFYGWWIVTACLLLTFLTGGIVVFGFTAFFEPIAKEFSWSYAKISLAVSLRGVEVGILAPLVGLVVDRWGPRRLAIGATILCGLGLITLSRMNSLVMFYIAFALLATGISGLSMTVVMTAAANWFRKKVGIAMGIMSCGLVLGALLVPGIVKLIDVFDWRKSFFILAIVIWSIALPLSLLIRHKPEQYGYLPDGEQSSNEVSYENLAGKKSYETDIRAREALKSRAFWQIGLSTTLQFLAINSVLVHIMPYLSSVGIARSVSSLVAMSFPLISIFGRLGSGWLGDKLNKILVTFGFIVITGIGMLCFSYTNNERMWLLIPFVVLYGIGWGGSTVNRVALLREYFGRANFGTLLGFMVGMTAIIGMVGPVFAGLMFDNLGSYQGAWLIISGIIFTAAIIIATIPRRQILIPKAASLK